jgi:hypothetical protein
MAITNLSGPESARISNSAWIVGQSDLFSAMLLMLGAGGPESGIQVITWWKHNITPEIEWIPHGLTSLWRENPSLTVVSEIWPFDKAGKADEQHGPLPGLRLLDTVQISPRMRSLQV